MTSCVGCGFENRDDAAFCGECGRSLAPEVACPSCARPNPEGRKFCDGCGARLLAAAHEPPRTRSAPAGPAVARSPRDYTPRHLADKILRSKSALEGERKRVTVLFADVKGSMELAESVDPERWHGILDRFFQILTDGVHRFEGTVNQYTGDGIMALFGAPIAHEDHAQRACYAALHLRDALRGYAQELRREHGLDFATRIGLNSGDVVVGKIGDDLRMDYTAQGHTVGLAQRMEGLAEAGAIYLSEATGKLVTGYFELEDLGEFNVKGSGAPLHVHALLGIGRLRTRLDLSRSRGLSRFVGRAEELARLEAALERADAGQAQVVGIVADAGTGKSRLCFEFAERCRARGQTILEAYAPPHGKNVPLLPVLQLLRSAFGIEERDSAESARDKIAGRVVLRDESLTRALPLLFDLLGVADPSKPPIDAAPELREREIMNVIRSLLRSRSAQRVGTILIEDLHWLDPGSESFLAGIVEAVVGSPTLLVLNFRPEYRAAWMGKSYYQQIALQPLGPLELSELLRDLLGDNPSLVRLSDRILRHTGGNPFFIEEVVRSLKESGVLEGERGAYRLIGQIDQLEIPASVQGILAARIDALPERDKHVLQTAAVIGATVARPLLEAVVELPESALDESLRQLVGCELLYESALYPEPELSFKHALTRDVAYASLLGERRADLHAAVADALAALEPERLDENAALLAHHREQAGQKLEAARAHERAAIHAGMRRLAECLRHSSRVAELVGELPESEESRALGVVACARVLFRSGPHEAQRASELFERTRGWAERSADPSLLAQLDGGYASHLYNLGRYDESVSLLRAATQTVTKLGRRDLAVGFTPRITVALFAAGEIEEALELFEHFRGSLDITDEAGRAMIGVRPLGPGLAFRAIWLAETGRVREAQQSLERSFEIVLAHGDPAELSLVELNAAILDEQRGTAQAALAHWARVDEIGLFVARGPAVALAQLGRWREVEAAAQRWTEEMLVPIRAWALPALARARLELGDPQGAERILLEQIEDAPARGARLEEIRAQLALARVLSRTAGAAERERIERALARVAELIERTGARLQLGALAEEHASLQRALGDAKAERAALIEAQRLYTEMGATGHAERIAAELGA